MSSSATRQPSARKRLAVARPMPRAAPVTSATLCGEDVIEHPSLEPGLAVVDLLLLRRRTVRRGVSSLQRQAITSEIIPPAMSVLHKANRLVENGGARRPTGSHRMERHDAIHDADDPLRV